MRKEKTCGRQIAAALLLLVVLIVQIPTVAANDMGQIVEAQLSGNLFPERRICSLMVLNDMVYADLNDICMATGYKPDIKKQSIKLIRGSEKISLDKSKIIERDNIAWSPLTETFNLLNTAYIFQSNNLVVFGKLATPEEMMLNIEEKMRSCNYEIYFTDGLAGNAGVALAYILDLPCRVGDILTFQSEYNDYLEVFQELVKPPGKTEEEFLKLTEELEEKIGIGMDVWSFAKDWAGESDLKALMETAGYADLVPFIEAYDKFTDVVDIERTIDSAQALKVAQSAGLPYIVAVERTMLGGRQLYVNKNVRKAAQYVTDVCLKEIPTGAAFSKEFVDMLMAQGAEMIVKETVGLKKYAAKAVLFTFDKIFGTSDPAKALIKADHLMKVQKMAKSAFYSSWGEAFDGESTAILDAKYAAILYFKTARDAYIAMKKADSSIDIDNLIDLIDEELLYLLGCEDSALTQKVENEVLDPLKILDAVEKEKVHDPPDGYYQYEMNWNEFSFGKPVTTSNIVLYYVNEYPRDEILNMEPGQSILYAGAEVTVEQIQPLGDFDEAFDLTLDNGITISLYWDKRQICLWRKPKL